MQQHIPSGEEVAVAMPVGFSEGINAILKRQDSLAGELLDATPVAVDHIGQIVDIGTNLKGGLAA